jgi:hypothetical protein
MEQVSQSLASIARTKPQQGVRSLKTSTVIVESAILWSNKRQALGKRVIARFGDKNSDHNTILWTERNTLFIIESSSFRHSLLLEKSFFRK